MSSQGASWILPEWDQPAGVHSLISTRSGGISTGVYSGLNFGDHVGDEPERVAANRNLLLARIGARPVWLGQVHGVRVVDAADFPPSGGERLLTVRMTAASRLLHISRRTVNSRSRVSRKLLLEKGAPNGEVVLAIRSL